MWVKQTTNNLVKSFKEPQKVRVMDVVHNPFFNHQIREEQIKNFMINIDRMSASELYDYVLKNHDAILNVVFGNQADKKNNEYLRLFLNLRFLTTLSRVISGTVLNPIQKVNCCKIIFDYMSLPSERRDPELFTAMQDFGMNILRDTISILMSIGVSRYYAVYLTAAMNSSNNIKINIQRMNYIIADSKEFNEQMIINIYVHMSKYNNLTMSDLLSSHMFSVDPVNTDEQTSDMYSVISLAVLELLNNMTPDEIREVLKRYSNTFTLYYGGDYRVARFSLHSLSADFQRISAMAYSLQASGYPIP